MFDSLKKEVEKRKAENREIKEAVLQEQERIRLKRQNAKKNVLRKKIKAIDNFSNAQEHKRDARKIEKFEQKQKAIVEKERIERRNQMLKANRIKIVAGSLILVALLLIVGVVYEDKQERNLEENYNTVINCIVAEDFNGAKSAVEIIDADEADKEIAPDVKALKQYIKVQLALESRKGKPSKFVSDIESVTGIKNEKVAQQYKEALDQSKKAEGLQKKIVAIDCSTLGLGSKNDIETISTELDELGRYAVLVNDNTLSRAQQTITHMVEGDAIGIAMLAIGEIGKVSLASEDQIQAARKAYDNLPDDDKKEVMNYATLVKTEKKLTALKQEEQERIAAEKAEKERLAKEAKQAKKEKQKAKEETQQSTRSMPSDDSDYTVYITSSGKMYHADGCSFLRKSKIPTTKKKAESSGYSPCSRCHP